MATPDQDVWLVCNGYTIGTRQVRLRDYSDLLSSAPRRGRNLAVPLTNEHRFYPRRGAMKVAQLSLQIHGRWNDDSTQFVGNAEQHAHALAFELGLDDEDGGPLGIGLPSVDLELHVWDTVYAGVGQVHGLFQVTFPSPEIADAVLEVELSAGALVLGS